MLHRMKLPRLIKHRGHSLTNPRALHAQQQELQRHKLTDSLNKAIASRPEKDELVERNILPDSTVAPSLQNHQRELAAAMRRDSIEKHLQTRPSPAELIKEGILEGECKIHSLSLVLDANLDAANENPIDGP
jgi:hypothetical protein